MGRFLFSRRWVLIRRADLEDLQHEFGKRNTEIDQLRKQLGEARSTGIMLVRERGGAIKDLEEERRLHARTNLERLELESRAKHAEGIARGQASHIAALQRSNDKMLETITDMRRVGFALPDDILREATDPDVITTVEDDDLRAIEHYPHLAASDDE